MAFWRFVPVVFDGLLLLLAVVVESGKVADGFSPVVSGGLLLLLAVVVESVKVAVGFE